MDINETPREDISTLINNNNNYDMKPIKSAKIISYLQAPNLQSDKIMKNHVD